MIAELLRGSTNGKLAKGDFPRVGEIFGTSRKPISRLWKSYEQQKDACVIDPSLGSKRKETLAIRASM